MKHQNRYDIFIDKLTQEFAQITNFNLYQDDKKAKEIFNFIVKRFGEIHSFKTLFTNYYILAASKSVIDDANEIQKSKYKHLLVISKEDLKENYYETIRLGYIGMFHKYENYVNDVIVNAELLISELNETSTSLTKYIELTFNYKIKDWKNSSSINRLNWITICNKHYDGFPKKEPKHVSYIHLPENEKIKLTKEDFIQDIDILIKHYNLILQIVFTLALYKTTFDGKDFTINEFTDLELHQKIIDGKNQMHEQALKLIELSKEF